MRLSVGEIADICSAMKNNGVVLYGAGRQGSIALEILEREKFVVAAVADQEIGKTCGALQAISLDELCTNANQEVCIMTPKLELPDVKKRLEQSFELVVDYSIITWMLYYVPREKDLFNYSGCFPFNHYESPYMQKREIEFCDRSDDLANILDVALNEKQQLEFLLKIKKYSADFFELIDAGAAKNRYKIQNGWFSEADAVLLHSMLREYMPKHIIEIGSGFSTSVMLDTNEMCLQNRMKITCIEPYPDRLFSTMKAEDANTLTVRKDFVQNINLEEFDVLDENDVLFIDSSHVAKLGGDIPYIYFKVLPRLKKGVLIHIHDIFYPFTYPEKWIMESRAYDEAFVLRALLMNNNKYEILFFNDMMSKIHKKEYEAVWDSDYSLNGGSIWLRKE